MNVKEMIDEFLQGKISPVHLDARAKTSGFPTYAVYEQLLKEVKDAEDVQARLLGLLECIRMTVDLPEALEAEIRAVVNTGVPPCVHPYEVVSRTIVPECKPGGLVLTMLATCTQCGAGL